MLFNSLPFLLFILLLMSVEYVYKKGVIKGAFLNRPAWAFYYFSILIFIMMRFYRK